MRDALRRRVDALEAKLGTARTQIIAGFLMTDAEIAKMMREVDGRTRGIPTNVQIFTWLPVHDA
jgi:hypothetical protein